MKSRIIFSAYVVFLCFLGTSLIGQSAIEGTWKYVARKWAPEHKQFADAEAYKIITDRHWLSIGMDPEDHSLYWAMGGTYTFNAGNYSEKIDFFNLDSSWVGSINNFHKEMRGEFLYQSGPFNYEFFERVEPSLHDAKEMNPLAGVWDIVSAQYGDQKPDIKEQYGRVLKIITPSYFAGVFFNPDTGHFNGIAFGKQKVVGNQYIEDVLCFSWDNTMSNEPQRFTWEIKEDQFIQKGRINSDEYKEYIIHEVSNRVE